MFNVGAEGNVQLQQISILDMHICSMSVKEDNDRKKETRHRNHEIEKLGDGDSGGYFEKQCFLKKYSG